MMKDQNFLVLVRHGQSKWNAKNLFTGWKDPGLTQKGTKEAENAGKLIYEKNSSIYRWRVQRKSRPRRLGGCN